MAKDKSRSENNRASDALIFRGSVTYVTNTAVKLPVPDGETGTPSWGSDAPSVAGVNPDTGYLLTWTAGSARITADYPSGKSYYWEVTVTPRENEEPQPAPASSEPDPAAPAVSGAEPDVSAVTRAYQPPAAENTVYVSVIVAELGVGKAAESIGMDVEELRVLFHREQLELAPGVTEAMAYYSALLGVRNPYELSKLDADKLNSAFQIFGMEPNRPFPPPDIEEIRSGILGAGQFQRPVITAPDDEPRLPGCYFVSEVSEAEKGTTDESKKSFYKSIGMILQNGLDVLAKLDAKPPLPRIICGRVKLQTFDEYDREQLKDMIGVQVELGGIASPAQDKLENNEDLHCFTGGNGCFSIVMPDRYNMQETVTFTISENPNSPEVIRRKSFLGGMGARSITFTRRASEVMNAAKVSLPLRNSGSGSEDEQETTISLTEFFEKLNRLDKLRRENRVLKRKLQKQAEEWLEEKNNREKRAALLSKKAAAEEKRRKALTDIIDALRDYIQKAESGQISLKELLNLSDDEPHFAFLRPDPALRKSKLPTNGRDLPIQDGQLPIQDIQGDNKLIVQRPVPNDYGPNQLADNEDYDSRLFEIQRLIAFLKHQLLNCEYRLRDLMDILSRGLDNCEDRRSCVGTSPLNFLIDDNTYEPLPEYGQLMTPAYQGGPTVLDNLADLEDEFLLGYSDYYPSGIPIDELCSAAKKAKRELAFITAELATLPPDKLLPHEQRTDANPLEDYLAVLVPGYQPAKPVQVNDGETYVGNQTAIQQIMEQLGCRNENDLAELVNRLLNAELYADMGEFLVLADAFGETTDKPAVLPSVRLMGEGKTATFLPTDTAPSRIFSYGMIQRLVEPEIRNYDENGNYTEKRDKVSAPLNVYDFKQRFYADPEKTAIARSLGLGYMLNMHQAWVPDGFALGSLLYSLVLAPGEEQRIIIKEHSESYNVEDQASASDTVHDSYSNSQQDNEQAAFLNAANRYSAAHSDYQYSSTATSKSTAGIGICFGLIGGTSSKSSNSGSGSSNASQSDRYDEASQAAQTFQTNIKTESERISTAQRASIRVASSSDTESVASKIIANHNHSHVMTVQYWEVMRRYRMETCIEGIDLILFVPLEPVGFLPNIKDANAPTDAEDWTPLTLKPSTDFTIDKQRFDFRYSRLLKHADTLLYKLPYGYRSGLETMKKFAALPDWEFFSSSGDSRTINMTITGCILECDDIAASLVFFTGQAPLRGRVVKRDPIHIHESMNTRKDVLYFIEKARHGTYVIKCNSRMKDDIFYGPFYKEFISTHATTDRYFELDMINPDAGDAVRAIIENIKLSGRVQIEFKLPADVSPGDIASVRIENRTTKFNYRLSQDTRFMEDYEEAAVKRYEQWLYNYSNDNKNNVGDMQKIRHYSENLPECYTRPQIVLSAGELQSLGSLSLRAKALYIQSAGLLEQYKPALDELRDKSDENSDIASLITNLLDKPSHIMLDESFYLDNGPYFASVLPQKPAMHADDVKQMEKTLHHVATHTIRYSQAVWSSLTDDERIIMLEPYTVDMNFSLSENLSKQTRESNADEDPVPLLNCVNPHRVLGFYGNCMLLPFTYPERLAKKLGKTAGEIQDELYRYHTTSFRVPSTVISVPTEGMVGEAVLGATNVSEKVDITRFWNWKDSDIDHMSIDQSSFNGGSSLLQNAQTMRVDAPTQGVTPTAHIDSNGLAAALLARDPAKFADVLANTDIRGLLQNADNNASAGREAAVQASSGMVNTAVQAAADVAKAYFTGGIGSTGSGNNGNNGNAGNSGNNGNNGNTGNNGNNGNTGNTGNNGNNGNTGNTGNNGNNGNTGHTGNNGNNGNTGKPAENPDDHSASPSNPQPSNPQPNNPQPDNPHTDTGNNSGLNYTPSNGSGSVTPRNKLEEQLIKAFEEADAAAKRDMDPVSFYRDGTNLSAADASEAIERLSGELFKAFGLDPKALVNDMLVQ